MSRLNLLNNSQVDHGCDDNNNECGDKSGSNSHLLLGNKFFLSISDMPQGILPILILCLIGPILLYLNIKYRSNHILIFLLLACVAISIFFYGNYRCLNPNYDDVLLTGSNLCSICDLWSILHFLLFFMLAFIHPDCYIVLFIYGVLWEYLEYKIYHAKKSLSKNASLPEHMLHKILSVSNCKKEHSLSDKYQEWMYHKWSDIGMNVLGLLLGTYLGRKYR